MEKENKYLKANWKLYLRKFNIVVSLFSILEHNWSPAREALIIHKFSDRQACTLKLPFAIITRFHKENRPFEEEQASKQKKATRCCS